MGDCFNPRRVAGALAALVCVALTPSQASAGDAGSRVVVGTPRAIACAEAAGAGRADDAAMQACDTALDQEMLTPTDRAKVLNSRGVLRLSRGDPTNALADFDEALRVNPEYGQAMVNRGGTLARLGQPGPAVAALTRALQLGVSSPHIAYFNRGNAREALGDLRGAYEDYSTALEIQPDWGPAMAELARFARSRRERLAGIVGAAPTGAQTPAPAARQ